MAVNALPSARKRGAVGGCEDGEKPASIVSSRYPVTTAALKEL